MAKMVPDPVEEMHARGLSRYGVCFARVELQIKLLTGGNQGVDHLHCILHVHVIIAGSVHFQKMSVKLRGKIDRRALFVRSFILREQTFVTLSIDGIVVMPVSYRRYSEPGLKAV